MQSLTHSSKRFSKGSTLLAFFPGSGGGFVEVKGLA